MLLFFGLFGCTPDIKNDPVNEPTDDPMCDAICNEQYIHDFSKSLESYTLEVSFNTADGELDSIVAEFTGNSVSAHSVQNEVSVQANQGGIQITSPSGLLLDNVVFMINNTEVSPTFVDSTETEVCGSVCSINNHTLNTDNIEEQITEITIIEELSNIYACATSTTIGDLFIVAHNDDYTQALIIHEIDGYDVPGGGVWENGFFNPNLSVEFHTGTNVGANYCTDSFEEEEIIEIFVPIDASERPEGENTDDMMVFDYGPQFPDCEGCVPFAMLYVENFWFRSEQNNYSKIEMINNLQTDIWFNYGG